MSFIATFGYLQFFGEGCRKGFFFAKNSAIEIALSQEIFDETKQTLFKPKLQRKLTDLGFTVDACLDLIARTSVMYTIQPLEVPELRDPKDAMVLATAIASQADAIISGDSDLLILETYQNIPILTAKQFLDNL
ncbi:putative toxin-antitoxin system toxin component, PIN family [Synechocystis salina]|uniref:putative toxin-antitoxin system toxin component, PIN family n=1 Tax=Synechocystis salina TaxID=945780 RepID=UPI001D13FA48|nr:putative toxin-antitoxin system toxin component, PIN family [Synechocystis salina]